MAEIEDAGEDRTSSLDGEKLFKRLQNRFKAGARHTSKWRAEAKDYFGFIAGDQWTTEERSLLEDQQRVPITFNRALSIIKAIAGSEINGRQEVRYLPRGNDDQKLSEFLSAAGKYLADCSDAEDEESDAFQDALICGMGWTEQRLDYEKNQDGDYVEDRTDPLEMYWDPSARKKNLADCRWVARKRSIPLQEAKDMFPNVDDDDLHAGWADQADLDTPEKTTTEKLKRDENFDDDSDTDRKTVTVVHFQWWEREPYYLVVDPLTKQKSEMPVEDFELANERATKLGRPIKGVRMSKKIYRQAFLGGELMGEPSDVLCKDHFSYQCITGERDRNAGVWYGLVRIMHDPQKWANKFFTQLLHIINSIAKGGVLAEKDAFDDQRKAETDYAKPQGIVFMSKGALSGQHGPKVIEKPGSGSAATALTALNAMLEFSVSSIRDTTGINLELLGMRDANQPGILEAQRKQAAMTILATMFDSLRRYRKAIGRIRLYIIQNYLSDDRLIRITGEEGAESLPLSRDKTAGDYDVVVDDVPTSPTMKEYNWQVIQAMLPAFKDFLSPEIALAVLEFSPMPSAFAEKVKKAYAAAQQNRQPSLDEQKLQLEQTRLQGDQALEHEAHQVTREGNLVKAGIVPVPPIQPMFGMMNGQNGGQPGGSMEAMLRANVMALTQIAQAMGQMAQAQSAPKRVVKDAEGEVIGVEMVPMQ